MQQIKQNKLTKQIRGKQIKTNLCYIKKHNKINIKLLLIYSQKLRNYTITEQLLI